MKTAIIVDSTAYLPEELAQHPDIYQVELSVVFEDGQMMKDSASLEDHIAFYRALQESPSLPKSSQPQPGFYYQTMDLLVDKGYEAIITIHLSAGISGTYQLSRMVLSEYADQIEGYAVNSRSACIVEEVLVRQALHLLECGKEPKEVAQILDWQKDHTDTYMMVEALDNLAKGGRLSSGLALVGSLLKVRPVLRFDEEGKIVLFEKIRTNKKVFQRWIQLIKEKQAAYPKGVMVLITHANNLEDAERIKEMVMEHDHSIPIYIGRVGPVIGTHTGERCLGLAVMPEYDPSK